MKTFYEIDPFNHLVIKKRKEHRSKVKKFRQVLSGRFKIDAANNLYYEVLKSSGADIPQKIKFDGSFSLDKAQNLVFTLTKWNNQYAGNRLRIKAGLVGVSGNGVGFLINSRLSEKEELLYTIGLRGSWQADKNNRLTFGVEKERGGKDILTFSGAWSINKSNEIEYKYGSKPAISLKGEWVIRDRYSLGYVLDKKSDTGIDFKSSLGRIIPSGKAAYLKFGVSILMPSGRRVKKEVVFEGKWKYAKGADIVMELSPRGRKASLKFTKDILDKQGQAYIEFFLREKEKYFDGGMGFRW